MKILAIDTSCDDTCIAVLEIRNSQFEILSNIISSQVKLHAKYGGVYPSLAKREHQKNLPLVFKKALRLASLAQGKPDLVGVTVGPGLEPCLWQGINFAKEIAQKYNKPLISVNHVEAHILANWLEYRNILLPAVCLVVSGGHTQLILMQKVGRYKLIGETRDDAAGECFDKAARILGLGYPGGPAIAKLASQWKLENQETRKPEIELPRPMIHQKNYDFSFSGLKTAVLYKVRELTPTPKGRGSDRSVGEIKNQNYKRVMCAEIQQAIIDVLICKTIKAAKNYKTKSIILGGGVAANNELRKQFKEKIKKEMPDTKYYVPNTKFCTDNAVMIGITAFFHTESRKSGTKVKKRKKSSSPSKNIRAEANLQI